MHALLRIKGADNDTHTTNSNNTFFFYNSFFPIFHYITYFISHFLLFSFYYSFTLYELHKIYVRGSSEGKKIIKKEVSAIELGYVKQKNS